MSVVADCYAAVDYTAKTYGGLDILVSNASEWSTCSYLDVPEELYDRIMDIDLKGCYFMGQAAARYMVANKVKGKIVFISSCAQLGEGPSNIVMNTYYQAAKAGVTGLTRGVAEELKQYGINVNCVAPGGMLSAGVFSQGVEYMMKYGASYGEARKLPAPATPLAMNPDEVGRVVFTLCTPISDFMCGEVVNVNGGAMLKFQNMPLSYTAPGESAEMRADNLLWWTRLQRKSAPNICLNAVMQAHQYADKVSAVKNGALLVENGADSVLPMGVTNETLQYMSDNLIPVFGHVGCLSGWQTGAFGGYRRQGKTAEEAMKVFRQAYEYQECGMVGMTCEMTSRDLTNAIAKKLRIPVVQVAAGGVADGSEMVIFDLLGFVPGQAQAKHGKYYASAFDDFFKANMMFDHEVKDQVYPAEEHGWGMDPAEFDKFMNELDQKYPDVK